MSEPRFKIGAFEAIHGSAMALRRVGAINSANGSWMKASGTWYYIDERRS